MNNSVLHDPVHWDIDWVHHPNDYNSISTQQLQSQNKKALQTLKMLEKRLDKELQLQKKSVLSNPNQHQQTDRMQLAQQNIKNNQIRMKLAEKQLSKLRNRRDQLKNGLQSKLLTKKAELQGKVSQYTSELKQLKIEQNQSNKRLSIRGNIAEPQSLTEHIRLEEQLRVFSLRYVKLLEKFNRVSEQLAQSLVADQDMSIPQEIFDHDLELKEEEQYQQYQGIVKLSTILAKRNDSQNGKLSRIYSQKLKDLERSILNLGQLDKAIEQKETQLLQGKKNLELVKFKIGNRDEQKLLLVSEAASWRKSYSTSRLALEKHQSSQRQFEKGRTVARKLSQLPE